MRKILDQIPSVAEVAARLAPRSGDSANRSPSRRPPHEAADHASPQTGPPVLSYDLYEAARISGICRSILYREIRGGRLIAHKRGRSTLVFDDEFRAYLAALPQMPATKPAGDAAAAVADKTAEAGRDEVAS
jgi:hypothetical protein